MSAPRRRRRRSSAAGSSAARWRPSSRRAGAARRSSSSAREPGRRPRAPPPGCSSPQADARRAVAFFDLALESRGLHPEWARALCEETGIDVGVSPDRTPALPLRGAGRSGSDGAVRLAAALRGLRRRRDARADGPRAERSTAAVAGASAARSAFRTRPSWIRGGLTRAVVAARPSARGARVRTGSAGRRGSGSKGRLPRASTPTRGPIEAGATVDAAGAWAAFGGRLPRAVPVEPVRGQIVEVRLGGGPLETIVSSRGRLPRAAAGRSRPARFDARARRVPQGA